MSLKRRGVGGEERFVILSAAKDRVASVGITLMQPGPSPSAQDDTGSSSCDTGAKLRITHAPGADVLPVFSPDGKKLMWTSTRDGRMPGSQLFIADFVMPVGMTR